MSQTARQVLALVAITLIVAWASLLAKSTTMFVAVIVGITAARIALAHIVPAHEPTELAASAQVRVRIETQLYAAAHSRPQFDANGYDVEGYDVNGYDADGFGYDRSGYDWFGYDKFGRDAAGWDEYGYGPDGEPL